MEMGPSAWPDAQARPRGEVAERVLGAAQFLTREATRSRAQTPGAFHRLLSVPPQSSLSHRLMRNHGIGREPVSGEKADSEGQGGNLP